MPMEEPDFLQILKKYDILPEDNRCKIQAQKTKSEKANYYIQQVIKPSTDLYFPKLIQAMEQYYKGCNVNALPEVLVYIIAEMNSKLVMVNYLIIKS